METPISTRSALLAVFEREGAVYGKEAQQKMEEWTKGDFVPSAGSIYPALVSMEEEGLIRSKQFSSTGKSAGRPQCYFELTAKGREVLRGHREIVRSIYFGEENGVHLPRLRRRPQ